MPGHSRTVPDRHKNYFSRDSTAVFGKREQLIQRTISEPRSWMILTVLLQFLCKVEWGEIEWGEVSKKTKNRQ